MSVLRIGQSLRSREQQAATQIRMDDLIKTVKTRFDEIDQEISHLQFRKNQLMARASALPFETMNAMTGGALGAARDNLFNNKKLGDKTIAESGRIDKMTSVVAKGGAFTSVIERRMEDSRKESIAIDDELESCGKMRLQWRKLVDDMTLARKAGFNFFPEEFSENLSNFRQMSINELFKVLRNPLDIMLVGPEKKSVDVARERSRRDEMDGPGF